MRVYARLLTLLFPTLRYRLRAHGDGLAPQRLYARKVTHIVQCVEGARTMAKPLR